MQVANNYEIEWERGDFCGNGIFNGDIGVIKKINNREGEMIIAFDDKIAKYPFDYLDELETAYAITVHKSQGSEYRAVILSAWNGSSYLLNRSVLYTAITRAKDLLIIVGREDTIAAMTQNGKVGRRYSGLKLHLQKGAQE